MAFAGSDAHEQKHRPEGIWSILDTDLYKLTMQSAILKYFPHIEVTYGFTNRTPHKRLNRAAFDWLQLQVNLLANITVAAEEIAYLRRTCPYLSAAYLEYLSKFRFDPSSQIRLAFKPVSGAENEMSQALGDLEMHISGLWLETILYEVPLLALTSEAFFKFCDRDWTYEGQEQKSKTKGLKLLKEGCIFSEFGSRRRRDLHTHELVIRGLVEAQKEGEKLGYKGKLAGTSNVYFAMKFGIRPVGTVAHEWFMALGAITQAYESANEIALQYWVATFGKGVLDIALTDTFGTRSFLEAFKKPALAITAAATAAAHGSASARHESHPASSLSTSDAPIEAASSASQSGDLPSAASAPQERYADIFSGTRQDSGDPPQYIEVMRSFYEREGIKERKSIVFSDALNVEKCIHYKGLAEKTGIHPSFGIGTFFTNDFKSASEPDSKSAPLNIVIKLSSAAGNPAVKISDNAGKNTGDARTVAEVKRRLGYEENTWSEGDESRRW